MQEKFRRKKTALTKCQYIHLTVLQRLNKKKTQKTNTLGSVYIYNIVYCRSSRLWSLPTDDYDTGKTGACWLTANEPLK